jgi:hypothetical protein
MRTEEDLRAMFAAREDLAPDQHLVLEGTRQAVVRRRRRRTIVAAAAAAVVAVALPATARGLWGGDSQLPDGGMQAGASSSAAARVPSGPRPPFTFTVRPGSAAGWETRPVSVNQDVQGAAIRGAGGAKASLFVYRPGAEARVWPGGWDAADNPVRATVNGAPAWYSTRDKESAIRWQHAPGGWAVISSTSSPAIPRETLIALAEAVQFTTPHPARVPYRLGYLPTGYELSHFSQGESRRVVQFSYDRGRLGSMDITVEGGSAGSRPDWRADRTMAGRPADCTDLVDGRRCVVDFGAFTVDVGSGSMRVSEMERVVAGMTFADWDDPATWHDLDDAMPGR